MISIINCIVFHDEFLMQDDFVSVVTTVVQEVSRPSMDDKTRNVSIWLDDECVDCAGRRRRSGLKRRLESVNWHEIAERKKCADVVSDTIYNHFFHDRNISPSHAPIM